MHMHFNDRQDSMKKLNAKGILHYQKEHYEMKPSRYFSKYFYTGGLWWCVTGQG